MMGWAPHGTRWNERGFKVPSNSNYSGILRDTFKADSEGLHSTDRPAWSRNPERAPFPCPCSELSDGHRSHLDFQQQLLSRAPGQPGQAGAAVQGGSTCRSLSWARGKAPPHFWCPLRANSSRRGLLGTNATFTWLGLVLDERCCPALGSGSKMPEAGGEQGLLCSALLSLLISSHLISHSLCIPAWQGARGWGCRGLCPLWVCLLKEGRTSLHCSQQLPLFIHSTCAGIAALLALLCSIVTEPCKQEAPASPGAERANQHQNRSVYGKMLEHWSRKGLALIRPLSHLYSSLSTLKCKYQRRVSTSVPLTNWKAVFIYANVSMVIEVNQSMLAFTKTLNMIE